MKHILLFFILPFICSILQAQTDTFYVSATGHLIDKSKAKYKRIVRYDKKKKNYRVWDYFLSGELQMEGVSENKSGEAYVGEVRRYTKNGKLESVSYHSDYFNWTSKYYNQAGQYLCSCSISSCDPIDGEMPETFYYTGYIATYKDGKRKYVTLYYDNGKPASRRYFSSEQTGSDKLDTLVQYDHDGIAFNKVEIKRYSNDAENGLLYLFYPSSIDPKKYYRISQRKVRTITEYKNGKKVFIRNFDINGVELEPAIFIKGRIHTGLLLHDGVNNYSYYENSKEIKTKYFDDKFRLKQTRDHKTGVYTYYDTLGRVTSRFFYKNGRPYKGRLISDGVINEYLDGMEHGLRIELSNSMDTTKISTYVAGKLEGEQKKYFGNKPYASGFYKDGKPWSGRIYTRDHLSFEYEDGKMVSEIYEPQVNNNEFKFIYKKDFRNGTIISKNFWTEEEYSCTFKNEKDFMDGLFFESKAGSSFNTSADFILNRYKDGRLDGEQITFSNDGKIRERKIYLDGALQVDEKNSVKTDAPKPQVKNGRIEESVAYYKAFFNYVDDVKQDSAVFLLIHKGRQSDTLKYTGTYKDGKPYNGTFFSIQKIESFPRSFMIRSEYKDGRKNGLERLYYDNPDLPVYEDRNLINDTIVGIAQLVVKDYVFTNEYENGKLKKGYNLKYKSGEQFYFTYFDEFQQTDRSLRVAETVLESSAYTRLNGVFADDINGAFMFYKDANLIKTIEFEKTNRLDTFRITEYSDQGFISKMADGSVYAIGEKTDSSYIKVDYFIKGVSSGTIMFKDGLAYSGCASLLCSPHIKEEYGFDSLFIYCIPEEGTFRVQAFDLQNRVYKTYSIFKGAFQANDFYNLHFNLPAYERSVTIMSAFYDMEDDSLPLAAYSNENGDGITVEFDGRYGVIKKYKDFNKIDEALVTKETLRKKLEAMR